MARKLEVEIIGDASSLRKAVGQADSSTSKLGGTFGKLAKGGALAAGAAGVGALVYTLKTGIGEFQESQKVAAQTNAVLKSTGGVANVSAKQVGDLATSIMKKSGIDDEAIASGENLLLTFKNIRNEAGKGNDMFNQATKAAVDLSVAFHKDLGSSSVLVGKALNDPVKGLTALSKVGVTFTEGQKKVIKGLVDTGQTAKAQKIILAELNSQVKGSAEALGNTLPGQINIVKESFNNWAGDLVAKTIPVLQRTIGWLRDHWPEIRAKFLEMWNAVQPALVAFGELIGTVAGLIQKHWGTIGPIVEKVAAVIKTAVAIITAELRIVTALLRGDWAGAWNALKDLVRNALHLVTQVFAVWKATILAAARRAGSEIKDAIINGITGVASDVWALLSRIGSTIASKAGEILGWGGKIAAHLKDGIIGGLKGIGQFIVDQVKNALNALISRVNRALEFSFDTHIPKLGKVTINPPDIPRLAAGGVVNRPTMAVIGEKGPEAVVPLNRGGTMQPIQLVLDGRVLAEVLYDPFRNVVVQKGRGGAVFS